MANKKTFSFKDQSIEHLIEVLDEEERDREKLGTQNSVAANPVKKISDEEFYAPPSKQLLADLKRCAKKYNKISKEEAKKILNDIYREYGEIKRKNGYRI